LFLYFLSVAVFSWPWQIISGFYATDFVQALVFNGLAMMSVAMVTAFFLRRQKEWSTASLRSGHVRDYVFAFVVAFVIFGPALVFNQFHFFQEKPSEDFLRSSLIAFGLFFIYPILGFGEELGWRGYVMPRFLHRGPRKAVVQLGVIWAMWHWPLIITKFIKGSPDMDAREFGFMCAMLLANVLLTIPLSAIFAWVWARSRSVFVVAFMHGSFDWVRDISIFYVSSSASPKMLLGWPQLAILLFGGVLLWKGNFVPAPFVAEPVEVSEDLDQKTSPGI